MKKTELISRLAASPEERHLLSHMMDQIDAVARRNVPAHTMFLTPAEGLAVQSLIAATGNPRHAFIGGFDDAERKLCVFLPDWMEEDMLDPSEYITALRATWYAEEALTHRDFLGALMGMGIRRETVGDILVTQGSCDLLLLPEVEPFLRASLEHAGRSKLHLQSISLSDLHFPEKHVKAIHGTVPAMRLDAVASTGFSISRSKMAEAISTGRVTLNWRTVTKSDAPVSAGDVIACRGLGKCKVLETGGLSRKGRLSITLERYL